MIINKNNSTRRLLSMYVVTNSTMQLSIEEQISHVGSMPESDPVKFISILKRHFDIGAFIPQAFYEKYYSSSTNDRDISLEAMLNILLLVHFFKFKTFPSFIVLLSFAPEIREFCKLKNGQLPTESAVSKFKTAFDKELLALFTQISIHIIDMFEKYNSSLPEDSPDKGLSGTLIYDTSGVKPKVKENNPKFTASEVRKQENYKKYLDSKGQGEGFNTYAAAYGSLPKFAGANPDIRLDYVNGHFGYFYKFGLLANGFGIPLYLHFFDDGFYNSVPDAFVSMEDQKYAYDNASLKPVLSSFLGGLGYNPFSTFLGDCGFDSYDNYGFLNNAGFSKVLIPINPRNSTSGSDVLIPVNDDGIPCCPKNKSPFIADGSCAGKNRSFRLKYVCPCSVKVNGNWASSCEDKCRQTNSTVTKYTYPAGDTYNCASLRSDICLAAITKLITASLAFSLNKPGCMKNLKSLLKHCA